MKLMIIEFLAVCCLTIIIRAQLLQRMVSSNRSLNFIGSFVFCYTSRAIEIFYQIYK
jgi:hypothetical protein